MLDIQWRYVHLLFCIAFFGSWLGFALIWYIIFYYHGDLEEEHLPENQENIGWTPCVVNINNFASAFLFSLETQHTIGYGGRMTTEECPEAIFLMSFQVTTVICKLLKIQILKFSLKKIIMIEICTSIFVPSQ